MPVNASKAASPNAWRTWYSSGAVAQPHLQGDELIIDAIGRHYAGPAAGYDTLTLGMRLVSSGPDWSTYKPVCAVVVPSSDYYQKGLKLERIPGNAVPVQVFFPR